MALFSVEIGGSLGVLTDNLFPGVHRVLGSLAPGKVPGPKASPQLPPRLIFQGKSCPLCCLDAHWSTGGLAAGWASRQRATSRVKSLLSQAASSLASLLNLKAKWTSCCGKPRCQRSKRSPAGEACQEAPQHCSCCLAEPLWHRNVSSQKRDKLYPWSSRLFDGSHTAPGPGNAWKQCSFLLRVHSCTLSSKLVCLKKSLSH